jgi:hypothetical protein
MKMNTHEYLFLDPSEIKYFNDVYEEYENEDSTITYDSIKDIILSYPKFDKNITILKLNSLFKKIKDSLSQFGDKEYYLSKYYLHRQGRLFYFSRSSKF